MSRSAAAVLPLRRLVWLAAGIAACSVGAVAPKALAQEPATWAVCDAASANHADPQLATFCAGVRAERSMHALSRRYSDVWSSLAADQRSEFSRVERRWLSSGRYAERDACVAHHGRSGTTSARQGSVDLTELIAAECLAQVTRRRLEQVELRYATTQAAATR